jgi:hypothetical protein
LLFPFDRAEEYLRQAFPAVRRDGHRLSWPSWGGEADPAVRPCDYRSTDGFVVSEVVTLTQTCPGLEGLDTDGLSALNKLTTTAALVRRESSGPVSLIAKVGIFSTDKEAAERVYAHLICMSGTSIGWHSAMLSKGRFDDPSAQACGLDLVDDPALYGEADYQMALDYSRRNNYFTTGDKEGCTVEFPWDPGSVSNVFTTPEMRRKWLEGYPSATEKDLDRMAGRTSIHQIRHVRHPFYGNGVLSTLEVPLPVDSRSGELADHLNRWELSTPDTPPLFGAWQIGPRALSFATFIPNQFCYPGLPVNLTVWATMRNHLVRHLFPDSTHTTN